jgi:hypothetical protein
MSINLIEQLTNLYYEEPFQETKLSQASAERYFAHMLSAGCLATSERGGRIVGYVEYWRISYELFGRILCYPTINVYAEDIQGGPVCYLSDCYIKPQYRRTSVVTELKYKFFSDNGACDYFVGEAKRKKVGMVKTFSRQEAYKKWARKMENKNE